MVNRWKPTFCFSYFPLNIDRPILPNITTMKFECIYLSVLPYIGLHNLLPVVEDTFLKLLPVFPMLDLFSRLSKSMWYADDTITIIFLLQLFIEILCNAFVEKICPFPPFLSDAGKLLDKIIFLFLSWDVQFFACYWLH